jgi:hypothetical protein
MDLSNRASQTHYLLLIGLLGACARRAADPGLAPSVTVAGSGNWSTRRAVAHEKAIDRAPEPNTVLRLCDQMALVAVGGMEDTQILS